MTGPVERQPENAARCRCGRWVVYAVPLMLVAVLQITYLVAPQFYLTYVIEYRNRENQAVEMITFGCAFLGSLCMFWSAWRLRRPNLPWRLRPGPLLRDRGAFLIVGGLALATLFFAGEEISWGQTYLQWQTPDTYKEVFGGGETNLHNTDLNIKTLADLFLVVMFFALPILWSRGRPVKLPVSWAPAIPEGPVVFCMAVAFGWRLYKNVYRQIISEEGLFYRQFVEQIAEHKEMLAAVSLLMYGIFRVAAAREEGGKA